MSASDGLTALDTDLPSRWQPDKDDPANTPPPSSRSAKPPVHRRGSAQSRLSNSSTGVGPGAPLASPSPRRRGSARHRSSSGGVGGALLGRARSTSGGEDDQSLVALLSPASRPTTPLHAAMMAAVAGSVALAGLAGGGVVTSVAASAVYATQLPSHLAGVEYDEGITIVDALRRSNIGRRPSLVDVQDALASPMAGAGGLTSVKEELSPASSSQSRRSPSPANSFVASLAGGDSPTTTPPTIATDFHAISPFSRSTAPSPLARDSRTDSTASSISPTPPSSTMSGSTRVISPIPRRASATSPVLSSAAAAGAPSSDPSSSTTTTTTTTTTTPKAAAPSSSSSSSSSTTPSPPMRTGKTLWGLLKKAMYRLRGRYNAEKQIALENKTASVIEAVQRGEVVVGPVSEHQQVDVTRQGDLAHYTMQALQERRRMNRNPAVVHCIRQHWSLLTRAKPPGGKVVTKEEYIALFLVYQNVLLPDETMNEAARLLAIEEDWNSDSKGEDHLDYPKFFDALFELIDNWCETIRPAEYVGLAHQLYQALEQAVNPGEGLLAQMAGSGDDDEYDEDEFETEDDGDDDDDDDDDADGEGRGGDGSADADGANRRRAGAGGDGDGDGDGSGGYGRDRSKRSFLKRGKSNTSKGANRRRQYGDSEWEANPYNDPSRQQGRRGGAFVTGVYQDDRERAAGSLGPADEAAAKGDTRPPWRNAWEHSRQVDFLGGLDPGVAPEEPLRKPGGMVFGRADPPERVLPPRPHYEFKGHRQALYDPTIPKRADAGPSSGGGRHGGGGGPPTAAARPSGHMVAGLGSRQAHKSHAVPSAGPPGGGPSGHGESVARTEGGGGGCGSAAVTLGGDRNDFRQMDRAPVVGPVPLRPVAPTYAPVPPDAVALPPAAALVPPGLARKPSFRSSSGIVAPPRPYDPTLQTPASSNQHPVVVGVPLGTPSFGSPSQTSASRSISLLPPSDCSRHSTSPATSTVTCGSTDVTGRQSEAMPAHPVAMSLATSGLTNPPPLPRHHSRTSSVSSSVYDSPSLPVPRSLSQLSHASTPSQGSDIHVRSPSLPVPRSFSHSSQVSDSSTSISGHGSPARPQRLQLSVQLPAVPNASPAQLSGATAMPVTTSASSATKVAASAASSASASSSSPAPLVAHSPATIPPSRRCPKDRRLVPALDFRKNKSHSRLRPSPPPPPAGGGGGGSKPSKLSHATASPPSPPQKTSPHIGPRRKLKHGLLPSSTADRLAQLQDGDLQRLFEGGGPAPPKRRPRRQRLRHHASHNPSLTQPGGGSPGPDGRVMAARRAVNSMPALSSSPSPPPVARAMAAQSPTTEVRRLARATVQ